MEDLREKVASHLLCFQDSLCSSLDVLDPRYCGNAKNILLREETAPAHPNLDIVGETPNPDDEETYRHNQLGASQHKLLLQQPSSGKDTKPFVAVESAADGPGRDYVSSAHSWYHDGDRD